MVLGVHLEGDWIAWHLAEISGAIRRNICVERACPCMSAQIRQERSAYYDILEKTQRDGLDITPWLAWFLGCLDRAFDGAETTLAAVLRKARFWDQYAGVNFNDRQRRIINRLLDGFDGKLTTSKWAKLVKASQDTALRDIDDLVRRGVLARDAAGGRSTSYSLLEVGDGSSEGTFAPR
jgi:Fic family protein